MIYTVKDTVMEKYIKLDIKQDILLKHKLSIIDFYLLKEIDRICNLNLDGVVTSARYMSQCFPAIVPSRASSRSHLDNLVSLGLLEKRDDRDIYGKITYSYILSKEGHNVVYDINYKPKYSREDYFNAIQVLDHWNSIKETSTHTVKPFGEIQTKTIDKIIWNIKDLLQGRAEWCEHTFSISEIVSVIDKYTLKFKSNYKPEDKKILPKSLDGFFSNYRTGHSEFNSVFKYGVSEIRTTLDDLKDIGISALVLRKAYQVLSSTGEATNVEKLEIQKSIWRTYRRYSVHREVLLDELYNWRKVYRENFMVFNTFVFNFVKFIEAEIGIGNAKTGFLSFNRGNKVLELYVKHVADEFNIFLFPTEKQIENIRKSKIVVDK